MSDLADFYNENDFDEDDDGFDQFDDDFEGFQSFGSSDDAEALASAGYGTDEDYGYYGDQEDQWIDLGYGENDCDNID